MEDKIILIIAFLFSGLLEIGLSIPLILNKIRPNYLYGFRVGKTRHNEKIWYKANKYMGKDFFMMGFIISTGSLVLLILKDELSVGEIALIGLMLLLFPLVIILFRGFRYLDKL